jgi:putative phosphoesterase
MRILVVADIHGNRAALEAIREPFDVCVCVGDIVDYGPDPGACVDWVRQNAAHCVRGNHDHGVAQDVAIQGAAGFRYLTSVTRPLSVAVLTPEQRRYLADLPTSLMLTLGGKRFLLVHATPRDPLDEYAPSSAAVWGPQVVGLGVDFVLTGHTHQPYVLPLRGTTVVNPGSVGLTRDGDPRASYAVIEDGHVELKRVEYAVEQTVAASDVKVGDPLARRMLADTYRGGGLLAKWALKQAANGNGHGKNGHAANGTNGKAGANGTPWSDACPG